MRWVEGIVSILRCRACDHTIPHLIFSGDTDMVTAGLGSLSSIATGEIVAFEQEPDETGQHAQARVNLAMARDDLRSLRLLRSEAHPVVDGLSFQAFNEQYRPPTLIYGCPQCLAGEAAEIRSLTPTDYVRGGGKLMVLGAFEVRG